MVDEVGILSYFGVSAAVLEKPSALLKRLQQHHHLLLATDSGMYPSNRRRVRGTLVTFCGRKNEFKRGIPHLMNVSI